jgi:hypothetical protein
VFDDFELSHCESRFLSLAIIPWAEEDPTHLDRHPTGNDGLTCPCKRLVHVGGFEYRETTYVLLGLYRGISSPVNDLPGRIAYPAFTKTTNGRTGIRQAVEKKV